MKSQIRIFQPRLNGLAISAKRPRVSQRFRIEIDCSQSDDFSRPVKIRVAANPASKAARSPRFFAAGFSLNEPRPVLRILEPPPSLSRPVRKVREPIDWRICGEQDEQGEE